ncbi:MAG: transposase [Rhodospirillaceae bacterium]|nr:transposase [Rhodospirillaceae bacterium]
MAKLRQVDVLLGKGRSIGVVETTYRRWRNEYGGLKLDQLKRLKELETENVQLLRAVSDLTLHERLLNDMQQGKS